MHLKGINLFSERLTVKLNAISMIPKTMFLQLRQYNEEVTHLNMAHIDII